MAILGEGGNLFKLSDTLKYVNDYSTELYEDENGKIKERTTYVGPMIKFRETTGTVTKKLVTALVLTLLELAAVLISVFLEHTTAWWMFTMAPITISTISSLYLLNGAVRLPFKASPMKRDKYMHSIIRMFRASALTVVLASVGLLAEVIYRIIYSDWMFLSGDIKFLLSVIAEIGLCISIIMLLRSVDIDERELADNQ